MSSFYGLIGEKLGHSLSAKIHNLILNELDLKGSYNLFEVKRQELKEAIKGLKVLGAKGINVTIPYKIEVMKYLDGISKEAEKIGAINTIAFDDGILTGYNTDYYGFGETLKNENVDVKNRNVLILGTGGVSKAVAQYLLDCEIKDVTYVSRNPKKDIDEIKNFKVICYEDVKTLKDTDIIINCTPCGMYPKIEDSPVNKTVLSKFSTAVDLIYNPKETVFLTESAKLGMKTVNGLYMLVAQAVAAQEIWQKTNIGKEITYKIYSQL